MQCFYFGSENTYNSKDIFICIGEDYIGFLHLFSIEINAIIFSKILKCKKMTIFTTKTFARKQNFSTINCYAEYFLKMHFISTINSGFP